MWCHLVSDTSFDELHTFARSIGMKRIMFQGDHYDLHEDGRARAVAGGALACDSREIVRALTKANLRRGPRLQRGAIEDVAHLSAPLLTTARLTLRQWQPSDVAEMSSIDNDPHVMRLIGPVRPYEETLRQTNQEAVRLALRGWGKWAVVRNDTQEFIGRAGLGVDFELFSSPAITMAWRLATKHQGLGFATEAALAVRNFAFDELDVDELVAVANPINGASINVMTKIGMTQVKERKPPIKERVVFRLSSASLRN
jgi:RimJ/RimL family protein N-acetyltransferase